MSGKHIAPPPTFHGGKPEEPETPIETEVPEPSENVNDSRTIIVEEKPIVIDGVSVVVEKAIDPEEIIIVDDNNDKTIIPVDEALARGVVIEADEDKSFDEVIAENNGHVVATEPAVEEVPNKRRVSGLIVFGILAIIAVSAGVYALHQANIF
jgi:hypothetical protein